jgi:hypothetical protein
VAPSPAAARHLMPCMASGASGSSSRRPRYNSIFQALSREGLQHGTTLRSIRRVSPYLVTARAEGAFYTGRPRGSAYAPLRLQGEGY